MSDEILNMEAVVELLDERSMVYLLVVIAVLWAARKAFDLFASYNLAEQLTQKDNKAVALSFGGYLVGVGSVLLSVLRTDFSETPEFEEAELESALEFFTGIGVAVAWCVGAILLLNLARIANDRLILNRFSNVKELVQDRNLGTGAVECGSYVGAGLLMQASVAGESAELGSAIAMTLLYFAVGQVMFVAFGMLYSTLVRYDVHDQIEKDNAAAGVSLGMSLVAIAVLLAGYIGHSSSLPGMVAWFVISLLLLIVTRYLVDKLMLPGRLLDEEISEDRNWGAALVEGCSAIVVAVVVNACFLS